MIINIYIVMRPGGDRPYVSTTLPQTLAREPGMKVFLTQVDLPDFQQIDGKIETVGIPLPIDVPDPAAENLPLPGILNVV